MRHKKRSPTVITVRFQSTHPLRDATTTFQLIQTHNQFQSTHPLRDATEIALMHVSGRWYFNPRTPYGMRHQWLTLTLTLSRFQSTHPLRDATTRFVYYTCIRYISIHAPLTGCDLLICIEEVCNLYFNPRTPYGMRRSYNFKYVFKKIFQSTHPLRDATQYHLFWSLQRSLFQSTHPLRDATCEHYCFPTARRKFQSTHPLRDATLFPQACGWEGADFNPRTPYGMRPWWNL